MEIRAIIINRRNNYNCGLFKLFRVGDMLVWTKDYSYSQSEILIKEEGALTLYKDISEWNEKFYLELEPEDLQDNSNGNY